MSASHPVVIANKWSRPGGAAEKIFQDISSLRPRTLKSFRCALLVRQYDLPDCDDVSRRQLAVKGTLRLMTSVIANRAPTANPTNSRGLNFGVSTPQWHRPAYAKASEIRIDKVSTWYNIPAVSRIVNEHISEQEQTKGVWASRPHGSESGRDGHAHAHAPVGDGSMNRARNN